MKPLLVTSGEPAGIGPDICLALAGYHLPIVIMADKEILKERAKLLNISINFLDYNPAFSVQVQPNSLTIYPICCPAPVIAGRLDTQNASYVISMLSSATAACLQGEFSALITAPVNKAIINHAGIAFTGHTEFLAEYCQVDTVVMMLSCDAMNVALVTTHLPLKAVASSISIDLIKQVILTLHHSLQYEFGIAKPVILVAGLNPHAGEDGCLGREEIDIIKPAIHALKTQGIVVDGPFPADTLFTPQNIARADAFITMYHDQGLPVLKYAGFGEAVNVTLGLPIIRTSVDHGTALDLAGKGVAETGSLHTAINTAYKMAQMRERYDNH